MIRTRGTSITRPPATHPLRLRAREPGTHQVEQYLSREAMCAHKGFGASVAGGGEQFERAAAVGLRTAPQRRRRRGNGFVYLAFALYVAMGGCVPTESSDAKDRAAQAKNPSIKSAFEEVANGWLLLAEQVEWIDRHRSPVRDEKNNRSVR